MIKDFTDGERGSKKGGFEELVNLISSQKM
jgi:hypothetical protein